MKDVEAYQLLKKYGLETKVAINIELSELHDIPLEIRRSHLGEAYLLVNYVEEQEETVLESIRRRMDEQKELLYQRNRYRRAL